MDWINLQLFGGRGGSSGGGGREVKEQSGFEALASGLLDEDLTDKQAQEVKDYLVDFLRDASKLQEGQELTADKYNDYTYARSLEDAKKYIRDFLDIDYDTGEVDAERTSEFWNYDRRIYVSYDTSGNKYYNYDFDDPSEFKKLAKDLKSKKIKGIIFEDGWENMVAGKGITVLSPKEGDSSWFRFEQGKLPKKKK